MDNPYVASKVPNDSLQPSGKISGNSLAWIRLTGTVIALAIPAVANTLIVFHYMPFRPGAPWFAVWIGTLNFFGTHIFLYLLLLAAAGSLVSVGPSTGRVVRVVTATTLLSLIYVPCAIVSWFLVFMAGMMT